MATTIKRKKIVTVTVHGWKGEGPTVAEAKASAIAKIESTATGTWTPTIICDGHYAALLYREPSGWHYRTLNCDLANETDHYGGKSWKVYGSDRGSYEECYASAAMHIATLVHTIGTDPIPPNYLPTNQHHEYVRYCTWQNSYRHHRDTTPGATDEECRDAADRARATVRFD